MHVHTKNSRGSCSEEGKLRGGLAPSSLKSRTLLYCTGAIVQCTVYLYRAVQRDDIGDATAVASRSAKRKGERDLEEPRRRQIRQEAGTASQMRTPRAAATSTMSHAAGTTFLRRFPGYGVWRGRIAAVVDDDRDGDGGGYCEVVYPETGCVERLSRDAMAKVSSTRGARSSDPPRARAVRDMRPGE